MKCNIPLFNYDYFVFTEIWLSANIYDAEFNFDRYNNVFCNDRNDKTSKYTRRSGIA